MVVEPIAYSIVTLFAIGMAVLFLTEDPRSPTSRAIAVMLVALGVAFIMNVPASAGLFFASDYTWTRLFALTEIVILVAASEWILRVGRTEVRRLNDLKDLRRGESMIRAAQACAIFYGLAGALLPVLRREVWNVVPHAALLARPGYYVFAVPFGLWVLLTFGRAWRLLRADTDRAERVRLVALGAAAPFWAAGFFLGWRWNPLSFAAGEIIFLAGAIRYHVLQGQRGQYLSRFLSPALAKLVREKGLASTLGQHRVELSVVACDLRGFTAFADSAAPEEVMQLLGELYAEVGEIVNAHGGSIKDFAGDGILALVGAPIAHPDHAARAARMACAIRDRGEQALGRFASLGHHLGIGVGVASGYATVGTIGGEGRLEYAAVGPVVNLAARLCARAEPGQILAEQHFVALAGAAVSIEDDAAALRGDAPAALRCEHLGSADLKGFARAIPVFSLSPRPPLAELRP